MCLLASDICKTIKSSFFYIFAHRDFYSRRLIGADRLIGVGPDKLDCMSWFSLEVKKMKTERRAYAYLTFSGLKGRVKLGKLWLMVNSASTDSLSGSFLISKLSQMSLNTFIKQSRQVVFTVNWILFLHLNTHKASYLYILNFLLWNNLCIPLSLFKYHSCPLFTWCKFSKRLGAFSDFQKLTFLIVKSLMNTNRTKHGGHKRTETFNRFGFMTKEVDDQRFIQ